MTKRKRTKEESRLYSLGYDRGKREGERKGKREKHVLDVETRKALLVLRNALDVILG